jgi:NADPH:quinone reductase-like Zn-dependent oxidoreductase
MKGTMRAIVGGDAGDYLLADNVEIPIPGPGTILCRVHSVALNPYDALVLDNSPTKGAVGGCDFAGTVEEVGEGVTRFKVGDRVLAATAGLNPSNKSMGAFAEFALANENASCRIPKTLAFTEASSMGVGIAAAGLALFQAPGLQLPLPQLGLGKGQAGATVLVSGGATATGTMATQLLKM